MRPYLVITLAVAAVSGATLADVVTLKDGRTFEGAVTQTDSKVTVEMPYGTLSFPASDVQSIQRKLSVVEELKVRLARADRTSPDDVFAVAEWALRDPRTARQGEDLLRDVLKLNSDHPGARRLLGFVRIDGAWQDYGTAMKLARSKLDAGNLQVMAALLTALEAVASSDEAKNQVKDLHAQWRLRSAEFQLARTAYEDLAARTLGATSVRYAAMASLLKQYHDGMYLVREAYPPASALLAEERPELEPGPASLARPIVLEAALRDLAKGALANGRKLLEEGKKLEAAEPEKARARYAAAAKDLDSADALVPQIARSYRVEIARRQIGLISKDMNVEAGKFDALKDELGKENMAPAAYATHVNRMLKSLNSVKGDLESILQTAGPFEQELVLEITDANVRLQRVNSMRELLSEELHAPK